MTVKLKIPGLQFKVTAETQVRLPNVLSSVSRSGNVHDDIFVPPDYVKVIDAFDVRAAAREGDPTTATTVTLPDDRVMILEMSDGVTVVTSAERLHQTLTNLAQTLPATKRQATDSDILEPDVASIDALAMRAEVTRSGFSTLSSLITRIFTVELGQKADPILQAAEEKALAWANERRIAVLARPLERGVSYLATKALMWAIESRLGGEPGLYRWRGARGKDVDLEPVDDATLATHAAAGPLLIFIHGTASNTAGSFSDLAVASPDYFRKLEGRFGERIYALEHRTLSESPIDNALMLAKRLPSGARVCLVTHSRGGLVGDLLCLRNFNELIANYGNWLPDKTSSNRAADTIARDERADIYAEHRQALTALSTLLAQKSICVQRYVRVACPARGTRLVSGNLDAFMSGLLTVVGLVPALAGSPLYSAFKRVVLEVVKNRTRPELIPGVEAMLPESPMAELLRRASVQDGLAMSVIAGDIEGGGILKQLGVFFTDFVFFGQQDNDLVVDTDSMYAGIAPQSQAHARFEQGPSVNHFRYFVNEDSRAALFEWLTNVNVANLESFGALPSNVFEPSREELDRRQARRDAQRSVSATAVPVVFVLPGIMGSHLRTNRSDRIWFDPLDIACGKFAQIKWDSREPIDAEALFEHFYGDLCDYLEQTHQVERFPYDWRQPLNVLAQQLEAKLAPYLAARERPVRFLAHSMGGLVVRALAHRSPDVYRDFMQRDGARFIMLGTPNHGSHALVETLIGKADSVRMLARADLKHNLQEILDIIADFRGALQLLPPSGFSDSDGIKILSYFDAKTWVTLREDLKDFWFGNGVAALPTQDALNEGRWLWDQDEAHPDEAHPYVFEKFEAKTIYVYGSAPKTPAGIAREGGTWKMLASTRGDGTVTWLSGTINGIGGHYFMSASHGELPNTARYFPALAELLATGNTTGLPKTAPNMRDSEESKDETLSYDAGPPLYPTPFDIAGGLMNRTRHAPLRQGETRCLRVRVRAMDLRWVEHPVLIGHYAQDPIAGVEALIDSEIVGGQLTICKNLGLYAGSLGTATVVLLAQNQLERRRGSARGAIVVGLGNYDGSLSASSLTDAVRTGVLKYLLHIKDSKVALGSDGNGIPLTTVLLGYNSTAALSIADSVGALVRGVLEGNKRFGEMAKSGLYIAELDLVEIYLDTAITATHALLELARAIDDDPSFDCCVEVEPRVHTGPGIRQRLDDFRTGAYWPRLMITDADREQSECIPNATEPQVPLSAPSAVSLPNNPIVTSTSAAAQLGPAGRLRFLYIGTRARAETIVQQRQPGLVEKLVESQVNKDRYNEDFSRTLFQVLVPNDFKDAARQLEQIVLVLDQYTADLPWELMLADDKPLAVKTAFVRQLKSMQFRSRVRQAMGQRAYVVGNPSTAGFCTAFPNFKSTRDDGGLLDLPGAEAEADAVAQALMGHGLDVSRTIGPSQKAIEVLSVLYKAPYRILHIAAHGLFEAKANDGRARTGVVLSDGLLITAAEIEAMEIVPELVFLNCCHIGRVEGPAGAWNRLAHSVSRELIRIGVRAVVVAGWAVDDRAASAFAQAFYAGLIESQKTFGDAVFDARCDIYKRFPNTITWGAYQAYGDPSWTLTLRGRANDPKSTSTPTTSKRAPVSPQELIDRLEQLRLSIPRHCRTLSMSETRDIVRNVELELALADLPAANRSDAELYAHRPDVCSTLGALFADLGPGYYERASGCYAQAIARTDGSNAPASIKAIESLANLEARLAVCESAELRKGFLIDIPETPAKTAAKYDAEADFQRRSKLVERAVTRLKGLQAIATPQPHIDDASLETNAERASLVASAYKRWAAIHARAYTRGGSPNHYDEMRRCLDESAKWYQQAADVIERDDNFEFKLPLKTYPLLNWLLLAQFYGQPDVNRRLDELAQRCAEHLQKDFESDPSFWSALRNAEVRLLEVFKSRALADSPSSAAQCTAATIIDDLHARYNEALECSGASPKELDSALSQLTLSADFYRAQALHDSGSSELSGVADRLDELVARLTPDGRAT